MAGNQVQQQQNQIAPGSPPVFLHIERLINVGQGKLDLERVSGSQIADRQFSYIYVDFPVIIEATREGLSRFIGNQATLTSSYKQRFLIEDVISIWNLMGPSAQVILRICKLSFNGNEPQEYKDYLRYKKALQVLEKVENKYGKVFKLKIPSGSAQHEQKQFNIFIESTQANQKQKRMIICVDLSKQDGYLSLV